MKRPKLITILGPTAVGKTSFAVSLAKRLDCSILSNDARQFYKEMCIGTAVPTEAEKEGVKHAFIQHKSIHEPYSVGDFEKDAIAFLEKEFKEHKIAILVGGSNLYTNAVVEGLDYFPDVPSAIKEMWQHHFNEKGLGFLQQELQRLDPDYFSVVDTQNHVRLLRALNICSASKKPYSSFLGQTKKERPFDVISVEITMPREQLYARINKRVDAMVENGLIDEVKTLLAYKHLNALQTVGYRELFPYLEGKLSLEEGIETIKTNTRRFAKRQLTWLRNHPCMHHISYDTKVNDALLAELGIEIVR